jgi:hypothetical protein
MSALSQRPRVPTKVAQLCAEQGCAGDCLQPPLRSGFRQRLKPGVDMTADVKGCSQFFMSSSQGPSASRCPVEEAEPVRHAGGAR